MCKPASFVITKDKVFWSKVSDSHEDIIKEFSLAAEVAGKICIVRCEITPPEEGRFDLPAEKWIYKTDQEGSSLPEWFDASEVEARCHVALSKWISARVITENTTEISGNISVFVCGSATIERVYGSATIGSVYESATIERVCGSVIIERVCGSVIIGSVCGSVTIGSVYGSAKIERVYGSAKIERVYESATVSFYSAFSSKLTGLLAVVINRIGTKAKCHVGSEKTRTVTGK